MYGAREVNWELFLILFQLTIIEGAPHAAQAALWLQLRVLGPSSQQPLPGQREQTLLIHCGRQG